MHLYLWPIKSHLDVPLSPHKLARYLRWRKAWWEKEERGNVWLLSCSCHSESVSARHAGMCSPLGPRGARVASNWTC